MFGDFVKKSRLKKRITLRNFCKRFSYDPSNWSKIEREVLLPPKNKDALQKWAKQLDITDTIYFFDLAAIARGVIPSDIMRDKELVKKLPSLFRSLREMAEKMDGEIEDNIEDVLIPNKKTNTLKEVLNKKLDNREQEEKEVDTNPVKQKPVVQKKQNVTAGKSFIEIWGR